MLLSIRSFGAGFSTFTGGADGSGVGWSGIGSDWGGGADLKRGRLIFGKGTTSADGDWGGLGCAAGSELDGVSCSLSVGPESEARYVELGGDNKAEGGLKSGT